MTPDEIAKLMSENPTMVNMYIKQEDDNDAIQPDFNNMNRDQKTFYDSLSK